MIYRRGDFVLKICQFLCEILPVIFWTLLIFGFQEKHLALATLISALIHELGHLSFLLIKRDIKADIRGANTGFKIVNHRRLSYKSQLFLYLAGSFTNFAVAAICLILSSLFGEFFIFFAAINITTGVSNLLPIEGYDGYGAIKTYGEEKEMSDNFFRRLSILSTSLIFLLTVLSLYMMDRLDGGYWIFAIFSYTMIKRMERSLSCG